MKPLSKRIISLLLAAVTGLAALLQGCSTGNQTADTLIRIGVRMAVYEFIRARPDARPAIEAIATELERPGSPLAPASVEARLIAAVSHISDPAWHISALSIAELISAEYAQAWERTQPAIDDEDLSAVLTKMARVIREGASLAPRSGRAERLNTGLYHIVID